jgi:putative SOS response-associated peptidase YedK
MCGRYTLSARPETISSALNVPVEEIEGGTGRYNVAPSEQVLAVTEHDGQRKVELMRWGLVPPWSKDLKSSYKLINARVETAATSPAYRALAPKASRRALQIADGYYEWLKPEKRGEPRQPFHFQVDGGQVFAFAALWTPAKIDQKWIHSISLITCDSAPNRTAAAIHDRMPAILADQESMNAWLDESIGIEALELCVALPEERLAAHPANPAVNKAGDEDGPSLLIAPGAEAVDQAAAARCHRGPVDV